MAIISSGTIGIGAIQAEFGGASPVGLGSYYKGGSLVPSGVSGGTIPTSGLISIGDFYGASNSDLIPDALNWNDITKINTTNAQTTTSGNIQTISGITSAIVLGIEVSVENPTEIGMIVYLEIWKNGSNVESLDISSINVSTALSVSNSDTVQFKITFAGTFSDIVTATVSVLNETSGNTLLDTFSVEAYRI